MRKVLTGSLLAACLMTGALAGSTAARNMSAVYLEAGCLDGGPGPQFMDLDDVFPSVRAAQQYLREKERQALPDTGETDGICTPGTTMVFELREVPVQAGSPVPWLGRSRDRR